MGQKFSRTERNQDAAPVQITDRDQIVLEALLRFTLLTGEQLHQLAGGGAAGFRRRLRRLYDSGYVFRPPLRNTLFRYSTKRPMIYTLGRNGADFLRLECGIEVPKTNFERNAKERHGFRGQFQLLHDLGANGVVIDIEQALSGIGDVEVLSPSQVLEKSPEWTQKANKPFSFPTRFMWTNDRQYDRRVIPDGFVCYVDRRFEKPLKIMLCVEFDQKMSIKRSDPTQASIVQKIACYSAIFQKQMVKERFGFDAFRVLFVTTGEPMHLQKMLSQCQEYRKSQSAKIPPYPFYFTTESAFADASNVLDQIWFDGDAKKQSITRLGS